MALTTPTLQPETKGDRRIFLALFLFCCGLYANTLGHGYVLDDNTVIRGNPQVEAGIAGIPSILASPFAFGANHNAGYRPLSVATYAIEFSLFGYAPRVGHLVNVLLYALKGYLLLRVLIRLFWDHNRFLPLAATLLFLAHPMHTEVVANLKSRDLLLCFLGCLAALGCMLRYAADRRASWLFAGLSCFLLALLSRQSALPFAVLIPLTLATFVRTERRTLLEISIGLCVTALAYLALYCAIAGSLIPSGYRPSVSVASNALANIPSTASGAAISQFARSRNVKRGLKPSILNELLVCFVNSRSPPEAFLIPHRRGG